MKVRVKLYGTLRQSFPDYTPAHGIEVVIPEGAKVRDLVARMKIPNAKWAIVSKGERIMRPDDLLGSGDVVRVFEPVFGG